MHNLKGRQSAVLETFSGTVTLAQPHDLPEGASPRNQNMDFSVGSVFTRQGLVNPFTYSGNSAGPSGGGSAADTSTGGETWADPGNTLLDTDVYATSVLSLSQTVLPSITPSGPQWTNPQNATSTSAYASVVSPVYTANLICAVSGLSIPTTATVTGVGVTFKAYESGGASISCSLENVSGAYGYHGQALTTSSTSYTFGGSTDTWSATLTPAFMNDVWSIAFTVLKGSWSVYLNSAVITVYYTLSSSSTDAIDIEEFGFSIPSSSTPQGFQVGVYGYATAACTLNVQMLKNGSPVGSIESVAINVGTPTTLSLGGINDLFGESWVYSDLNNTTFGLRLTVSTTVSCSVYLGYTTLKILFLPTQENFNYVSTFEDSFGNIKNLAEDSSGSWWVEDVTNTPGVLSPLFSGPPTGSFASSFTADSRQFIAISDLSEGNYPPQGYNGTWNDRVSQVGPGSAPSFQGTLSSGSVADITAFSITSDVVTFTATNSFTAGEVVTIASLTVGTYLNGNSFNVLGTGLTTSAFEVSFTHANVTSTSDTGTATPQYTYPIAASPSGITQYASQPTSQTGFDDILWSAGPGSTDSGNVITIYYSEGVEDTVLDKAFQNQIFSVYVYVSGTNQAVANGTFLVTTVGIGTPPGGSAKRYYFTYNVSSTSYENLGGGANAQPGRYQMTVATLTSSLPLPAVVTGDSITLSSVGVSSWDETWTIVNALNSGSYSISETSMTSGTATYNWALSGATTVAPTVDQLVTVTGTLNGNGIFNVTDAVIATVTGTSSGTFTISGFAAQTYATEAETAQATTSGTQFQIDPGPLTLGSSALNSPIYGDSGGGYVTLVGSSSVVVGSGTRKGTVFFITRNGYYTAPAAPVQFNTNENTNYILVSNIPIGPPNVIARGIAFTEAGQEGQPGASYYTIPDPVSFVYNDVTYLSSSLIVNDNTTTTAKFTFPDAVLLDAEEIDIQGNDLFSLGELGDSAWCAQYAGRSVWGRVRNKIQNFVNLTFDGGYNPNPGSNITPLGWSLDTASNLASSPLTLLTSPIFGNSLYISNESGSAQSVLSMITQTAYQDWNYVAILQNQIAYSIRVTCRTPSSATVGALVIDLTDYNSGSGYGQTYGTYTLNLSSMSSTMTTYQGTLLTSTTLDIPSSLRLRVWASNLAAGGDIEIDRIEVFPTEDPTNYTQLTISYRNDWESFDQITGGIDTATVNTQPTNGAFILHDQLYIVKESSLGYITDTPNQEPANWNPYREVSNVAGACGINAYDVGEEWAVMACRNGLFVFNGGAPMPIQLEIPDWWEAINWDYGETICVRNDTANRRILISVPMATPNQWCPDFATNASPTQPNVVILLNYEGIGTIEELAAAAPMHVSMMGRLVVQDLRRKWSLWSIATPYMGICKRSELYSEMLVCNGIASSKIYVFGAATLGADDDTVFPWSYCTYGFVDQEKAKENPAFGMHNKRYNYYDLLISGSGTAQVEFFQNILSAPYPFTVPGGVTLSNPAANDMEGPLDELAQRIFVEVSGNAVGCWGSLSRLTLVAVADAWNPIRGF